MQKLVGIFNNCLDDAYDANSAPTDELDIDGDGYVECTEHSVNTWIGTRPTGFTDCDDSDALVYPSAIEVCDGQFNNCSDTGNLIITTQE